MKKHFVFKLIALLVALLAFGMGCSDGNSGGSTDDAPVPGPTAKITITGIPETAMAVNIEVDYTDGSTTATVKGAASIIGALINGDKIDKLDTNTTLTLYNGDEAQAYYDNGAPGGGTAGTVLKPTAQPASGTGTVHATLRNAQGADVGSKTWTVTFNMSRIILKWEEGQ